MTKTQQLWRTAYHEAGHVVVGLHVGLRVLQASIVPDEAEGTLGHVQRAKVRSDFDWDDDRDPQRMWAIRRKLEPMVMMAYVGVLAERRHSGRRHDWAGAHSDTAWAADCVLKMEGDGKAADLYASYLMERTKGLIEIAWQDIEAVAAALMDRRTLRPSEMKAVLGAAVLP
jgi:ATP-dependent Zn protease